MKYGLFYTIGIIVLTMVSVTTSPAQMQLQQVAPPTVAPSAPGPYYAPPSWDLQLPTASRFIILSDWGNTAVLDKETGLVWERSAGAGPMTWAYANNRCNNLTVWYRKGWRLPTVQELASLLDMSVPSSPKLPSGHPFVNVKPSNYWSATTQSGIGSAFTGMVASVLFVTGEVVYIGLDLTSPYVWCVRGGQGVEYK